MKVSESADGSKVEYSAEVGDINALVSQKEGYYGTEMAA